MLESKINPGLLVRIEVSNLSVYDKFMEHEPRTTQERNLKSELETIIASEPRDFYRPIIDPSFCFDGTICYKTDSKAAVGKSYIWWDESAKAFYPERKSRLGTRSEYIAFLGVLIKKLVEYGWSVDQAWDTVCNNSIKIGNYKHCNKLPKRACPMCTIKPTGSRGFCGFFDLANTYKILADDEENDVFWIASGCYTDNAIQSSLATVNISDECSTNMSYAVGWIVFEK